MAHAIKWAGIKKLSLIHNEFQHFSLEQIEMLGSVLEAANVEEVGLSLCMPSFEHYQTLGTAIKKAGIKSLFSRHNNVTYFSDEKWEGLCEALTLSHVNSFVSENECLHLLTAERWKMFGSALKKAGVRHLGLHKEHSLDAIPLENWLVIGEALKLSGIRSLNVNESGLGALKKDSWTAFCQTISMLAIDSLGLYHNSLDSIQDKKWIELANALKKAGVKELDLGSNFFHGGVNFKAIHGLLQITGITSLKLSHNFFSSKHVSKFRYLEKIIQETKVIKLELKGEDFDDSQKEKIKSVLQANERRVALLSNLKNACLFSLWSKPGAHLAKNTFTHDVINEAYDMPEEVKEVLQEGEHYRHIHLRF